MHVCEWDVLYIRLVFYMNVYGWNVLYILLLLYMNLCEWIVFFYILLLLFMNICERDLNILLNYLFWPQWKKNRQCRYCYWPLEKIDDWVVSPISSFFFFYINYNLSVRRLLFTDPVTYEVCRTDTILVFLECAKEKKRIKKFFKTCPLYTTTPHATLTIIENNWWRKIWLPEIAYLSFFISVKGNYFKLKENIVWIKRLIGLLNYNTL